MATSRHCHGPAVCLSWLRSPGTAKEGGVLHDPTQHKSEVLPLIPFDSSYVNAYHVNHGLTNGSEKSPADDTGNWNSISFEMADTG